MWCFGIARDAFQDIAKAMGHYLKSVVFMFLATDHILATSQIDHNFSLGCPLGQESRHGMLDGFHTQPITSIDQWRPPLELAHEVAEILGLVAVVELLDRSLGDYAAVVGVHDVFVSLDLGRISHSRLSGASRLVALQRLESSLVGSHALRFRLHDSIILAAAFLALNGHLDSWIRFQFDIV
jgi:hypothetical protein